MDAKSAVLISKTAIAAVYSMITKPGTYLVRASNSNRVFDKNLGKHKYIVNLKAIAAHNIAGVKAAFKGAEKIAITELNGLTMSANIIINEGVTPSIPMKNELVKVVVNYAKSRTGELILVVEDIAVSEPQLAEAFVFNDRPDIKSVAVTEEAKNGNGKKSKENAKQTETAVTTTGVEDNTVQF